MVANREKEIRNNFTQQLDDLKFKNLQIESRMTNEFEKFSALIQTNIRNILKNVFIRTSIIIKFQQTCHPGSSQQKIRMM